MDAIRRLEKLMAGSRPTEDELRASMMIDGWKMHVGVVDGLYTVMGKFLMPDGVRLTGIRIEDVVYVDPHFNWLLSSKALFRLGNRYGATDE